MLGKRHRHQHQHSQRPARGLSLTLVLVAAGLLTFGLRQRFSPLPQPTAEKPFVPGQEIHQIELFGKEIHQLGHPRVQRVSTEAPLTENFTQIKMEIQAFDDPAKREELIAAFVASIAKPDLAAWLVSLHGAEPAGMAEDMRHRLLRRWANEDPQAVAAWLPFAPDRSEGMADLAIVWANNDLTDAILWAQSLPEENERQQELEIVAKETVRTQPVTALQLAVNLPESPARDELIRHAAMEWAAGDPESAVAWAGKIPDAKLRSQVLAGVAVTWSDQDPLMAAQMAVVELPPGRLQQDTIVSIVQRWTQIQPESAAGWVEQFPDGSMRLAAVENLIALWSEKDRQAAQNWLAQHGNRVTPSSL